MNLKSMTGFSRWGGDAPPFRWNWELKAVNAKGLDLRLRVPPGFESIEPEARARLSRSLFRGTCFATLTMRRESSSERVRVNVEAAEAIMAAADALARTRSFAPLSLDGLLAVRGVVETADASADDEASARASVLLTGLDEAIERLLATRRQEGRALAAVLDSKLRRIASLVDEANRAPGRRPDAVRARLVRLVEELSGASSLLDPARLHQEAVLLAAKADVTEEIDRLRVHTAAAWELLASERPVGRRLDFLAQELSREANTLCAKSNDAALTALGVELRVEIEQFREQVQNIE